MHAAAAPMLCSHFGISVSLRVAVWHNSAYSSREHAHTLRICDNAVPILGPSRQAHGHSQNGKVTPFRDTLFPFLQRVHTHWHRSARMGQASPIWYPSLPLWENICRHWRNFPKVGKMTFPLWENICRRRRHFPEMGEASPIWYSPFPLWETIRRHWHHFPKMER